MKIKPLVFIGGTRVSIRQFPRAARRDAGWQLHHVQLGKNPKDWKPMHGIGLGVKEIRIHQENEYRVLYVAQFQEAVYVLAAFQKTTEKTPLKYITAARIAYAKIKEIRQKTL